MNRILEFLRQIGLSVSIEGIAQPTFLPGIRIAAGGLVIDPAQLKYPGDLLHEAGHLAVIPPHKRYQADGEMSGDGGEEMAAIAWSYAAALHLKLEPAVVFHDDGYNQGARSLLENFADGRYVGLPMLVWLGLTTTAEYPEMRRWLTDEPAA
jgi:hypothetical protein